MEFLSYKCRPCIRLIAIGLALTFTFHQIAMADLVPANPQAESTPKLPIAPVIQNPSLLKIPFEEVTLQEIHAGTNGKLIIHIQDAHANLGGQTSLANALDDMMSRYAIPTVFVEGGDRDVTLDAVKEIADEKTWSIVAGKFLSKGIITGPEYLNLTSRHDLRLLGIEYADLYEKNLRAYARLASRRQPALRYIHRLEMSLDRAKNRLYPEELLKYESGKLAGEREGSRFTKNADDLLALSDKYGVVPDEDLGEVAKLRALKAEESSIDFEKASEEKLELFIRLSKDGASHEVQQYVKAAKRAKNVQMSQYALLNNILGLADERGFDLEAYPNLRRYRRYLGSFSDLNFSSLIQELASLESALYRAVLPNDDVKKIYAIDQYVRLLRKAYSIQMSSDEFETLVLNEPIFEIPAWLGFLNEKLSQLGYLKDRVEYEPLIDDLMRDVKDFYQIVQDRDQAFLENTGRLLEESGQDVGFFIAGGYHTANLTRLMRREGYSYVVMTPTVTHETDHARYERILLESVGSGGADIDESREEPRTEASNNTLNQRPLGTPGASVRDSAASRIAGPYGITQRLQTALAGTRRRRPNHVQRAGGPDDVPRPAPSALADRASGSRVLTYDELKVIWERSNTVFAAEGLRLVLRQDGEGYYFGIRHTQTGSTTDQGSELPWLEEEIRNPVAVEIDEKAKALHVLSRDNAGSETLVKYTSLYQISSHEDMQAEGFTYGFTGDPTPVSTGKFARLDLDKVDNDDLMLAPEEMISFEQVPMDADKNIGALGEAFELMPPGSINQTVMEIDHPDFDFKLSNRDGEITVVYKHLTDPGTGKQIERTYAGNVNVAVSKTGSIFLSRRQLLTSTAPVVTKISPGKKPSPNLDEIPAAIRRTMINQNRTGTRTPLPGPVDPLNEWREEIRAFTHEETAVFQRALEIRNLAIGFDLEHTLTTQALRKNLIEAMDRHSKNRLLRPGAKPLLIGLLANNGLKLITSMRQARAESWIDAIPILKKMRELNQASLIARDEIENVARQNLKLSVNRMWPQSPYDRLEFLNTYHLSEDFYSVNGETLSVEEAKIFVLKQYPPELWWSVLKIPHAHRLDVVVDDRKGLSMFMTKLNLGDVIEARRYRYDGTESHGIQTMLESGAGSSAHINDSDSYNRLSSMATGSILDQLASIAESKTDDREDNSSKPGSRSALQVDFDRGQFQKNYLSESHVSIAEGLGLDARNLWTSTDQFIPLRAGVAVPAHKEDAVDAATIAAARTLIRAGQSELTRNIVLIVDGLVVRDGALSEQDKAVLRHVESMSNLAKAAKANFAVVSMNKRNDSVVSYLQDNGFATELPINAGNITFVAPSGTPPGTDLAAFFNLDDSKVSAVMYPEVTQYEENIDLPDLLGAAVLALTVNDVANDPEEGPSPQSIAKLASMAGTSQKDSGEFVLVASRTSRITGMFIRQSKKFLFKLHTSIQTILQQAITRAAIDWAA